MEGTASQDPRTPFAHQRTQFAKYRTQLALDRTTVVRKNHVRCSDQKLKDLFGVLRPEFMHVTMLPSPRILLIVKSDGVFGTHNQTEFLVGTT
jgi:hypothetical protein